MSNRSTNNNNHTHNSNTRGGFKGGKTHLKFVPKNSNFTPQNPNPNPNPNFSTTLRQPDPSKPATIAGNSGSRIQLGDNGKWVSSKTLNGDAGRGNFVIYLPQEESVASGLGGFDAVESQRVVDLLNRELASLLSSKPRNFWNQVASDASLHEFLDSYLQYRSRWYDFPYHGAKGTVAGVIVGDLELSRRVFMVLYRISSNKDPGARASNSLSQKDHEALLQEKKLLDLPKLLDICAVYGHENEDITRLLVLNAINAQPWIYGSFTTMISHFLGIVRTMYQRCISSMEALISAGGSKEHGFSSKQEVEFLEVMDFLNDAVVSMDAFIRAYRPAAIFFSCPVDTSHGNEELINVLATLHDSLLPSLHQGLQIMLASGKNDSPIMLSDVSSSLRILAARIVDLVWKLVDSCYLSDDLFKDNSFPFPSAMKMYPASVEDPVVRADILVQTFKEISSVPQHARGGHYGGTFLLNMEKKHQVMLRIQTLRTSGWIQIEDEQYQYLLTMMPPMITATKNSLSTPTDVSNRLEKEEDAAITESRISQVKDIFPDYGNGFISACLDVYNHNPEEVIQRILEGTLHLDLQSLNTSMETIPPPKSTAPPKKDKGKGILDFSTAPSANSASVHPKPWPEPVTSSSSSSMMSSVGRFVRKSENDGDNKGTLDSRDGKHMEKTAALLSQYEYEDEYDDSFDDLGMTAVESGVEETEILSERIKSNLSISESRDSGSGSGSGPATSKWGSRKKPQFYVKDGKNYSYKVDGAIAVADEQQASLVTKAQKETIHGLGRGGNLPLGAVRKLEENEGEVVESDPSEVVDGGGNGNGGRGRGRGRGRNHYRKDRAMKKHMTGVGGF